MNPGVQPPVADTEDAVLASGTAVPGPDVVLQPLVGRLQALAEPTRVRILNLLAAGELCVCDVVEILDLPQPTVSRHLATLREQGWVTFRRVGRFFHYALAQPTVETGEPPGPAASHVELVEPLVELVERLAELPGLDAERRRAAERAASRREDPC